jgi:multidrug efflux pump subunit AcrA (membrane-fusion protein)
VLLDPDPLTPEQISQLQGENVRVTLAVGATDGEVLSVPLAALTAGPGGESRVEVVESDPREGDEAKTRLVVVEPGLAAKGAVEVTPIEGKLAEDDLVVVGR